MFIFNNVLCSVFRISPQMIEIWKFLNRKIILNIRIFVKWIIKKLLKIMFIKISTSSKNDSLTYQLITTKISGQNAESN